MSRKKHLTPFTKTASVMLVAGSIVLSGCAKVETWSIVHKIDISQGNIIERENVNKLRPGMTKEQVRFLLGTPILNDPFHTERWDYIYRFKPGGQEASQERITLHFVDSKLSRIEGDIHPEAVTEDEPKQTAKVIIVPQVEHEEPGFFAGILSSIGLRGE